MPVTDELQLQYRSLFSWAFSLLFLPEIKLLLGKYFSEVFVGCGGWGKD
jgi:hypothetical protein